MDVRKIDPSYIDIRQNELIMCSVLKVIEFGASESKFNVHSLF